ncbi:hypothetical protein ABZP36_029595 [Zizania latifolia]
MDGFEPSGRMHIAQVRQIDRLPENSSTQEPLTLLLAAASLYHPDVNKEPGATDKFKEISAAYEMRRRGHSMINTVKLGFKSAVGGSAGAYTSNPFDLFETFFGASMGGFSGTGDTSAVAATELLASVLYQLKDLPAEPPPPSAGENNQRLVWSEASCASDKSKGNDISSDKECENRGKY